MIGRLRGVLAARRGASVLVDVGGIGHEVAMPSREIGDLPPVGEEVVVHTHLHVREDQMALYGFTTEATRDLFRVLVATQGVGPKLAVAMLATMTTDQIRAAVHSGDAGALTTVPGIGGKTAQKLIIELRSRLDAGEIHVEASGGVSAVRHALEGLGYTTGEIREALEGLDTSIDVEDLLRAALQKMGGR
ncbi:MAG TPA: Holliday junction branch migration protein RuvA [Acidimicrobiia bacterium]|nr:Holliday junction branch migration protein RuvA [Acidimicrobiia bacterium]